MALANNSLLQASEQKCDAQALSRPTVSSGLVA